MVVFNKTTNNLELKHTLISFAGDVPAKAEKLSHHHRRRQGLRVGSVPRERSYSPTDRTLLLQQSAFHRIRHGRIRRIWIEQWRIKLSLECHCLDEHGDLTYSSQRRAWKSKSIQAVPDIRHN